MLLRRDEYYYTISTFAPFITVHISLEFVSNLKNNFDRVISRSVSSLHNILNHRVGIKTKRVACEEIELESKVISRRELLKTADILRFPRQIRVEGRCDLLNEGVRSLRESCIRARKEGSVGVRPGLDQGNRDHVYSNAATTSTHCVHFLQF